MREMTFEEINGVSGGMTAKEAGYETGKFVGKTLIGASVVIALYAALATA